MFIDVDLSKAGLKAAALVLKETTPDQSCGPRVSTTEIPASIASYILVGLFVVYILPEVSIITIKFFPPVVAAMYHGLILGS